MTSRQQRRAAERQALKQTIRNGSSSLFTSNASPVSSPEAHTVAVQPLNRYDALIAAASPAILFPGEEGHRYRSHLHLFYQQHQPESGMESDVVKRLADLQWRLKRIATLEAGLMLLGRRKYADHFADAAPDLRNTLIDAHTLGADKLTLKSLHAQEAHLRRYYANDLRELATLQKARLHLSEAPLNSQTTRQADSLPATAAATGTPPVLLPDDDGFEFSFSKENVLSTYALTEEFLGSVLGTSFLPDSLETEIKVS